MSSRIFNNVTDSIRKSIIFVENAHEIWKMLEHRFMASNGSMKYRLNKKIYETKQESRSIIDYNTEMKVLWEDLDYLNYLPPISYVTTKINTFISTKRWSFFSFWMGHKTFMAHNRVYYWWWQHFQVWKLPIAACNKKNLKERSWNQ